MEFKFQDILKNIIPGVIMMVLLSLIYIQKGYLTLEAIDLKRFESYSEIVFFLFLTLVYFIGFIIDAIASIIENKLAYKILKKPSFRLLSGKVKSKYSLVQREIVLHRLLLESNLPVDSQLTQHTTDILFKMANWMKDQSASGSVKEKTIEYYNSYIFVRNICCAFLFTTALTCFLIIYSWGDLIMALIFQIIVLILIIIRWRQRAYYYTRQVLQAIGTGAISIEE